MLANRSRSFGPLIVLLLLTQIADPAFAPPKKPTPKELRCAIDVVRRSLITGNRAAIEAARELVFAGSDTLPVAAPTLDPVQLMMVKTVHDAAGTEGLTEAEVHAEMDARGFIAFTGYTRRGRAQNRRRSPDYIGKMLRTMAFKSDGNGHIIYMHFDGDDGLPRYNVDAFAKQELRNWKFFLKRLRERASAERKANGANPITFWTQILSNEGTPTTEVPAIRRAQAVILGLLNPATAEFVTNLAGDAVFDLGLGTPSDPDSAYKIIQMLHADGYIMRKYEGSRRQSWNWVSDRYVGNDTAKNIEKLHAWSLDDGERALAQFFRFHQAVLRDRPGRKARSN